MAYRSKEHANDKHDVHDAMDNEQEISDALHLGKAHDSPELKWLYECKDAILEDLNKEEDIARDAVGKLLWKMRIESYLPERSREEHPEYSDTLDTEVAESEQKLQRVNPVLQAIAQRFIEQLSLPDMPAMAAAT